MLYLVVQVFFPHFRVLFEDGDVGAPNALEAGDDPGRFNIHEQIDETQAGKQVFEREPLQHEVHPFGQE